MLRNRFESPFKGQCVKVFIDVEVVVPHDAKHAVDIKRHACHTGDRKACPQDFAGQLLGGDEGTFHRFLFYPTGKHFIIHRGVQRCPAGLLGIIQLHQAHAADLPHLARHREAQAMRDT